MMRRLLWISVGLCWLANLAFAAVPTQKTRTDRQAVEEAMKHATATLRGRIVWPNREVRHATIQVFKDSALKQLYTEGVLLGQNGEFEVKVEPGTYYLVAFVDANNNGEFDTGDGMGIYGITEWNDRTQKRQPVRVESDQTLEDLTIPVTAVMAEIDGEPQILALDDPLLERMGASFSLNLQKLLTGVRGQVIWPDHPLEKALVFAYTDLSWKYRSGYAVVGPDGKFEIKLPPGKYYLLCVVDQNASGNFDAGDPFGIYGIAEAGRGQLPQPVLVEPNRFTEGLTIPIIGTRPEATSRPTTGTAEVRLKGQVVWPGHPIRNAIVEAYRDATLTQPVAQVEVDGEGRFEAILPPGDYYLIASVDEDGDGTYSAGDAIGGYGTPDIAGFPPRPLTLTGKGPPATIRIEISARYDSAGQLYSAHSLEGDLPTPPREIQGSGIAGRILWPGQRLRNVMLLLSDTPDFESPQVFLMQLPEDGSYTWPVPPGEYYLMAVVDANGNRLADAEDGVGIYGTRNPLTGTPQQISVLPDHVTPYLDIEIRAIYTDMQGTIAPIEDAHRAEIRLQYGDPEDLYQFTRFGKIIQEWWYWSRGIAFIFESLGLGWKLSETKHFDPALSEAPEPPQVLNGVVYYTYDQVIWGIAPDGHHEPLAAGSAPSADVTGQRICFLDPEGAVRVIDPEHPSGQIVLDRSEAAARPVISPDGRYIVYVHRLAQGSQLRVLHLPSGETHPVPSAFRECDTPAWSPDGRWIAYAASGSVDRPGDELGPRNLYLYDIENERIEPIVVDPAADDAEPAWAPDGSRALVFSRAEGGHRQLWRVVVDREGKSTATQLTQYGGSHPVWLPDGSGILYENNGQLWVITPDGKEAQPFAVRGKRVMGNHPFASPASQD